ncbi:MAG: membrane protein [Sulfurovum sp. AS07-7]|nr:MAG: membrane protein [Sulfurovum sp. AS07-7]
MKIASIIVGIIFVLYAIMGILQLWFNIIEWSTFVKLSITAMTVIIVTFGVAMLYREYIDEKKMKEDKYID